MAPRRKIFETDLYRYDSHALAQAFDEALERGDVAELSEILIGASVLMSELTKTLDLKYGKTSRSGGLGASRRYTWKGWLPSEVMADLKNAKQIQGDWIERIEVKLPDLSKKATAIAKREHRKFTKKLRGRIKAGRQWVNARWPGWWTVEVEDYFHEWL